MKKQKKVGKLGAEELEKRSAPLTLGGGELTDTSRATEANLDQQTSESTTDRQTEMPTKHPRNRPGPIDRI